jgi:hypothetical protein
MSQTNPLQQQQSQRMGELAKIARQRYLDAGGDPQRSANGHEWLADAEKQEYLTLARQLFDAEYIDSYLEKNGTWRERLGQMKQRTRLVE